VTEIPAGFQWGAVSPHLIVGDPGVSVDVAQLSALGLTAWRFPILWSALQPEGRGAPERAAIDFYQRLVDSLCERGIAGCAVLSGGELPGRLARAGGWLSRDTAGRFADHADLMFRALGDRVARWVTHEDPRRIAWPQAGDGGEGRGGEGRGGEGRGGEGGGGEVRGGEGRGGEVRGGEAGLAALPGLSVLRAGLPAAHHLLLAHGRAVEACRAELAAGRIGLVLDLAQVVPLREEESELAAVRLADALVNRWFLEPVLRGAYPREALERVVDIAGLLRFCREGDLATIAAPIDFLSIGYEGLLAASADDRDDLGLRLHPGRPGQPVSHAGREIAPGGLSEVLGRLAAEHEGLSLLVEGSSAALLPAGSGRGEGGSLGPGGATAPAPAGSSAQVGQLQLLHAHLEALASSVASGAQVEGYLLRTLTDGPPARPVAPSGDPWTPASGLLQIDASGGARTPRAIARYLERVARDGLAATEPRPA
jgi:beta-glucosidase